MFEDILSCFIVVWYNLNENILWICYVMIKRYTKYNLYAWIVISCYCLTRIFWGTEPTNFSRIKHREDQEKSGMSPKTLQYFMHRDIGVMLNTYPHLGMIDTEKELKWIKEFRKAQVEWKINVAEVI